jgi:hypothetical protein
MRDTIFEILQAEFYDNAYLPGMFGYAMNEELAAVLVQMFKDECGPIDVRTAIQDFWFVSDDKAEAVAERILDALDTPVEV